MPIRSSGTPPMIPGAEASRRARAAADQERRAAEIERGLKAATAFIAPDGTPHDVREMRKVIGTTSLPCTNHECFAEVWLAREKKEPSETARRAAAATENDFGPYESELIFQGWTRARNCNYVVRARTKNALWDIFMWSKVQGCGRSYIELYGPEGLSSLEMPTLSELEQAAEWAGLARRSRKARRRG